MGYFKGKQFKKDIILVAVGYYCRFSLSYRDVSEILKERGVSVHPTTIMRWVHEYGNLIYQMWKKKHKFAYHTWHLDETYIKVKGNGVIYIELLIAVIIHWIFNFAKNEIIKQHMPL
ncbi:hypothetical protein BT246_69260 (plasmid) [Bacillus thuringiensis]|uniref:IS6 family transposase n=1 Tax=Bacillus thuringiensis TaxID=1428 RepID=A0A9W3X4C9_BACTU|nr:hypothetical protein BT246_69260 [Bacillus thuringiensis]